VKNDVVTPAERLSPHERPKQFPFDGEDRYEPVPETLGDVIVVVACMLGFAGMIIWYTHKFA
jgi:hypothetical protein